MRVFFCFRSFSFLIFLFISTVSFAEPPRVELKPELTSKKAFPSDELNFGVLVYNDYFKIYRSGGLGAAGLRVLKDHLSQNKIQLPSKIVYLNSFGFVQQAPKSWRETKRFTLEGLQRLYEYAKVKISGSVIYHAGSFASEQEALSNADSSVTGLFPFQFVHGGNQNVYLSGGNPLNGLLEPMVFRGPNGEVIDRKGGRESLYQILKEILVHEGTVLFHCKGGFHRTGMTGLMIRYLQGGQWTDLEPTPETRIQMAGKIAVPGQSKVEVGNLAEYEYLLHNPSEFRKKNWKAMRLLAEDERFQCLKRNFSCFLNATGDVSKECGPFDRQKLWDQCAQWEPETQLAAELDDLERLLASGGAAAATLEEVDHAFLLSMRKIESLSPVGVPKEKVDQRLLTFLRERFVERLVTLWKMRPQEVAPQPGVPQET